MKSNFQTRRGSRVKSRKSVSVPDVNRLMSILQSNPRLQQAYGANFDWKALARGIIEAGTKFGDFVYPHASLPFKAAGALMDHIAPKSVAKSVKQEVRREEKKEERKEAKVLEKKEGFITGARPYRNLVRPPRMIRTSKDTAVFHGVDSIRNFTSGASGIQLGAVVGSVRINPLQMDAQGLRGIAARYERYRLSGKFILSGGAGTGTNGSLVTFVDYDPDDTWSFTGQSAVSAALAHTGAQSTRLWEDVVQPVDRKDRPELLFLDDDTVERRLTDEGNLYIIASQEIPANVPIGQLFFDWTLELAIRSDDSSSAGGDVCRATTPAGDYTVAAPPSSVSLQSYGIAPTYDVTNSRFVLAPGSYVISCMNYGTTTTMVSGSAMPTYGSMTSGVSVYTDPGKNWYGFIGDNSSTFACWFYCEAPFWIQPWGGLGGTCHWRTTMMYINATTKSPLWMSNRATAQTIHRATQVEKELAVQEKIRASLMPVPLERQMASTSADTSGSAPATRSSPTPNLAGQIRDGYVTVSRRI